MAILKGVGRWRLLVVHALPNALASIANVVALNLAFLPGRVAARLQEAHPGQEHVGHDLAVVAQIADQVLVLRDGVTVELNAAEEIIARPAEAYLDLLRDLQERLEVGYLFISHDISTVARVADTIAVMQNGRVVEYGPTGTVLRPPHHPYTELLLKSVPDMRTDWLDTLEPLGRRATGAQ